MNHRELGMAFFDNRIRTEAIIHLGTMCHDYAFPTPAEEAFDDEWVEVCKALSLDPDKCQPDNYEEISAWLAEENKLGFLIKFGTPSPTFTSADSWSDMEWGVYALHWIYAESIEEAFDKAKAWRIDYLNAQRVKQGFNNGSVEALAS